LRALLFENPDITSNLKMTEEFSRYLMTEQEKLVYRHLVSTMKASVGKSDPEAQETAKSDPVHARFLSDDPEILHLAKDGYDAFVLRTGERILRESGDKVVLNLCPASGKLARTPTARQCRYCLHDWHEKTANTESKDQNQPQRKVSFLCCVCRMRIADEDLDVYVLRVGKIGENTPSTMTAHGACLRGVMPVVAIPMPR
jgi:hypothetical protein